MLRDVNISSWNLGLWIEIIKLVKYVWDIDKGGDSNC